MFLFDQTAIETLFYEKNWKIFTNSNFPNEVIKT